MKKRARKSIVLENQWLNSYSDMVSLLLVFFIVLFSMMRVQYDKSKEEQKEKKKMIEVKEDKVIVELNKIILNDKLQEYIQVVQTPSGATLKIKEMLLFDSGKEKISKEQSIKIRNILLHLMNLPEDYDFLIEGHTDDVPMSGENPAIPTNWHLSILRAMNILHVFESLKEENPNFSLSRIGIAGYGSLRPKDPLLGNSTPNAREQNRRIEIKIQYNKANAIIFEKMPQ